MARTGARAHRPRIVEYEDFIVSPEYDCNREKEVS